MRSFTLVDQTAAAILGTGSISILNFGTRLPAVLLGIGPTAASTAILPRFSQMTAAGLWKKLKRSFTLAVLVNAGAMALLTGRLVWFSEPIVRIAFQRGAFTVADSHRVALVQSCSLLQVPFAVGLTIVTRLVASMKANSILMPVSIAGLLLNIAFDYTLMTRYGVAGIAISAAIVQGFMFAILTAIVLRRLSKRDLSTMAPC
jgi:putative peptidoglycan lipid II flippase